MDTLLEPFLRAASDHETEKALAELFDQAIEPVLTKFGKKLRGKAAVWNRGGGKSSDQLDIEDLLSETRLRLIDKLFKLKGDPAMRGIDSIAGYASVTANSARDGLLRKLYPMRTKLSDRVRYVLNGSTNRSGFALWSLNDDENAAGFESWAGSAADKGSVFQSLYSDPGAVKESALEGSPSRPHLADMVAAAFHWVGAPIEFDALVSILAVWTDTRDEFVSLQDTRPDDENPIFDPPDLSPGPRERTDSADDLKRLWVAVLDIKLTWRTAFLLHAHITFDFVHFAVTDLQGIAAALEIPADDLARIWDDIPLEDLLIAKRMNLTRQQVINLRRLAREALAKKVDLANFSGSPEKYR